MSMDFLTLLTMRGSVMTDSRDTISLAIVYGRCTEKLASTGANRLLAVEQIDLRIAERIHTQYRSRIVNFSTEKRPWSYAFPIYLILAFWRHADLSVPTDPHCPQSVITSELNLHHKYPN